MGAVNAVAPIMSSHLFARVDAARPLAILLSFLAGVFGVNGAGDLKGRFGSHNTNNLRGFTHGFSYWLG